MEAPPAAAVRPEPIEATPATVEPAAPPPPPASPAAVAPARIEIALVVDGATTAHASVADEVDAVLPPSRYRVNRLDSAERLAAGGTKPKAVVAVGRSALEAVQRDLPGVPVIYCQVLRSEAPTVGAARLWGVAAWPPAAVSLAAWRSLDPTLRTIMLIVSDAASPMVADALAAARAQGIDLRVEESSSDRETLYLFRRFSAAVDGLWLLPDERALGPTALLELLRYAAGRDVGVLAFSDSLLPRGALLSATSVPADIAAAVQRVVDRVAAGETAELSAVTPLTAAALAVNRAVAEDMGLPAPRAERWIAREFD